jgi:hypothetical protein
MHSASASFCNRSEISMTTLTTKTRKSLPKKDFALPGGKYPVEDKAHAANAKARASAQYRAGKLSAADRAKVDTKADAVLAGNKK